MATIPDAAKSYRLLAFFRDQKIEAGMETLEKTTSNTFFTERHTNYGSAQSLQECLSFINVTLGIALIQTIFFSAPIRTMLWTGNPRGEGVWLK